MQPSSHGEKPFSPHAVLVRAGDRPPSNWMLVVHGVLGSGSNLRSLCKRLAEARPDWGFCLVDLRLHGASQNPPPPHTIAAAAADLAELEGLAAPVRGIVGHSLGGKVALAYAANRAARGLEPLAHLWVLDASPSANPGGAEQSLAGALLDMLASIPQPLPSRERFLAIVQAAGYSAAIAEWLAMNVRRDGDAGFVIRFDFASLRALVTDYFGIDLWNVLERPVPVASRIAFVLAGRAPIFSAAERARLARAPNVATYVLERAGHWLHVDDPDGLFAVLASLLGT